MISAIERAVIERLTPLMAPLPVDALVSVRGERFKHTRGAVVLAITDVRNKSQRSGTEQRIEVVLEVSCYARTLNHGDALYAAWANILDGLLLWRAPGLSAAWVLDAASLQEVDADTWAIVTRFVAPADLAAQSPDTGCPDPFANVREIWASWAPRIGAAHLADYFPIDETPAHGSVHIDELLP